MEKRFIKNLQGKDFVLFEGLLNEFHNNGGKSIHTNIISTDPLIFQATVDGEKGTYQGIGDADEGNVNGMVAKHKIRMAETRAIARALRWYNNIGMCCSSELGEGVQPKLIRLTDANLDLVVIHQLKKEKEEKGSLSEKSVLERLGKVYYMTTQQKETIIQFINSK